MNYANIPDELKRLAQWCGARDDGAPLNPRNGYAASVINPKTWGTFEQVVAMGVPFIGFVLHDDDPYCIIDLDNKPDKPLTAEQIARQKAISDGIVSYQEISRSGRGLHIVVRAEIPKGFKKEAIEIYSAERFMIFTGNVYRAAPIIDAQEEVDSILEVMGYERAVDLVSKDQPETMTDAEVCEMASSAENAEKFDQLWRGDWEGVAEWPSQSEADFALMAMLCFYSKNNNQCRRLFWASGLNRPKATEKYLNRMIAKCRAKEPPPADLSALAKRVANNHPPKVDNRVKTKTAPIVYPTGLVGDLAQYLFDSALRPVREISLATSIALLAGIVGRSYNISKSGLNQYIIVIASTGSGKDGISRGVNTMLSLIRNKIPAVDQFVGPAIFASGQALVRVLDERPCFVSVLGEFGLTLRDMCDPRAIAAQRMLKRTLLDLYSKSGWDDVLRQSAYSDTDKNTSVVQAPAVSFIGESTPDNFYDTLTPSHVAEGLVPRLLVIEYMGDRPEPNPNQFAPPSADLIERFMTVVEISLTMRQNNTYCEVLVDPEAASLLDKFNLYCDAQIRGNGVEVERHIWNRAHLKALRLAALVAVGIEPRQPKVTGPVAQWAVDLITHEVTHMVTKFAKGEVGEGEQREESDVRNTIDTYFELSDDQKKQYKVPVTMLDAPVVPYCYLRRRLRQLSSFKNSRYGSKTAITECIKELVTAGILVELNKNQLWEQFKTRSPAYSLGPSY